MDLIIRKLEDKELTFLILIYNTFNSKTFLDTIMLST